MKIVGCAVCGSVKKAMVEEQLTRPVEWLSSMPQAWVSATITAALKNMVPTAGLMRWAVAVLRKNACVVVSCGTAVTTDALTEDNHYLGGTIMPGST